MNRFLRNRDDDYDNDDYEHAGPTPTTRLPRLSVLIFGLNSSPA